MTEPVNKVEAKFIPFKCSVCNGFGSLSYGKIVCHACKGKGVLLVNQETGEIHEQRLDKTSSQDTR